MALAHTADPVSTACPRHSPILTSVPDAGRPAANAVRIIEARDPDRIARLLLALEEGPAQSLDLQPRAERTLHDAIHRPVVRASVDGWCWFLSETDIDLTVRALRLDPEIVGGPDLPSHRRRKITDLVADAFVAAQRQAFDLADRRNGLVVVGADQAGAAG